jgi:hypothetical protein
MAMAGAIAMVASSATVTYCSVNVVALLPNNAGAKIETVTSTFDSSVENYEIGRKQFNLYGPPPEEHVIGFRKMMENFAVKRVSILYFDSFFSEKCF